MASATPTGMEIPGFMMRLLALCDPLAPGGGRFQAGVAVALGQALEPDAGAVGLLRMTPGGEDGGDQGGGVRSDLLGPADEAVGCPFAHPAVLLGHMLCRGGVAPLVRRADVAGDALAAMEALDGAGRQSDVELAADERVRDRVVVPVDLDVVVDGHADGLPLGEDVGADGQRAQCRPVELLERRAPRPRELAEPRRVLSRSSSSGCLRERARSIGSGSGSGCRMALAD